MIRIFETAVKEALKIFTGKEVAEATKSVIKTAEKVAKTIK